MITHGKVAVIIGGSEGLGRACAECLLQRGAKVCIADKDEATGLSTERDLQAAHGKHRVAFLLCDVTCTSDVANLFSDVKKKMGSVDIFCPASETPDVEDWQSSVDIIYKGAIRATYEAMRHMSRRSGGDGGSIVYVTSSVAIEPSSKLPVYCASRYALVGFLRAWASKQHFEKHGIRFNGLCLPHVHEGSALTNRLAARDFLRLVQDDFLNGQILRVMDRSESSAADMVKFPPFKRKTDLHSNN